MKTSDVYNRINEVEQTIVDKIIQRLEFRDNDPLFTRWRDDYLNKLPFSEASTILDAGCGTGVVTRAIAKHPDVTGKIVGSDFSPALIETARQNAKDARLDEKISFRVDDIHSLGFENNTFDIIVAHTVFSHIDNPKSAVSELARVLKPDGIITIFDGDYASINFAYPDDEFAKQVEAAFINIVANNPRIMRKLPLILSEAGLDVIDVNSYVFPEVGTSTFFMSAIETYVPMIAQSGQLPEDQLREWLEWQRHANQSGKFFAASNYYTYIVQC